LDELPISIVNISSICLDWTTKLESILLQLIFDDVLHDLKVIRIAAYVYADNLCRIVQTSAAHMFAQTPGDIIRLSDIHLARLAQVIENVNALVLVAVVNKDGCRADLYIEVISPSSIALGVATRTLHA
jgi:hypothetical protein